MAEPPQNGQAARRNPSTNKNIRKLRTASMVCSLTRSWQQWVVDNEDKQAKEPSGWAPSWMGEPPEETKKAWVPKTASKAAPDHNEATMDVRRMDVCQKKTADSGERKKSSTSPPKPKTEAEVEDMAGPPQQARIRTKQVVKTVTSVAKEKSAGVGLLAEKITKEALLPSADEIDRMLNKRSSPSRRRKCSNMVSSLTKSWKERQPGMIGGRAEEGHTPDVDRVDDGASEKKKSLDTEGGPNNNSRSLKKEEEEQEDLTDGYSVSAVKIKRPSALTSKKGAEDADKINALSKKYSAVGNLKSRWQNWASEHTVNQKLNPFSEEFDYEYSMSLRLHKGEEGYGRPKEGTKTAERARRAEQHIHREIDDMCYVIRTMADPDRDGKTRITFGELFDRYVRISDKVVGILMRARKHGKLAFDGEMLWQGQDDGVIITLLV